MYKLNKMCEILETEIGKIADKGLTTSNLDTAYKLIDMYKDIKTVEGMEDYADYDDGSSYRGRDRMGRYTRNTYPDMSMRYAEAKRAYRNNQSYANKQDMMDSLSERMESMVSELEEMRRDADTAEERQTIDRYISKIRA